jgi:hypothetical protein
MQTIPRLRQQAHATGGVFPTRLSAIVSGRDILSTDEAATALNRKPQTLRKWACLENGPLRPFRINGRLAWRVAEILAILNGEVLQ